MKQGAGVSPKTFTANLESTFQAMNWEMDGSKHKQERLNQTKVTFICNVLTKVIKIEDEQQSLIYILEMEDNIKERWERNIVMYNYRVKSIQ